MLTEFVPTAVGADTTPIDVYRGALWPVAADENVVTDNR